MHVTECVLPVTSNPPPHTHTHTRMHPHTCTHAHTHESPEVLLDRVTDEMQEDLLRMRQATAKVGAGGVLCAWGCAYVCVCGTGGGAVGA
jgi:hypothetical protein